MTKGVAVAALCLCAVASCAQAVRKDNCYLTEVHLADNVLVPVHFFVKNYIALKSQYDEKDVKNIELFGAIKALDKDDGLAAFKAVARVSDAKQDPNYKAVYVAQGEQVDEAQAKQLFEAHLMTPCRNYVEQLAAAMATKDQDKSCAQWPFMRTTLCTHLAQNHAQVFEGFLEQAKLAAATAAAST